MSRNSVHLSKSKKMEQEIIKYVRARFDLFYFLMDQVHQDADLTNYKNALSNPKQDYAANLTKYDPRIAEHDDLIEPIISALLLTHRNESFLQLLQYLGVDKDELHLLYSVVISGKEKYAEVVDDSQRGGFKSDVFFILAAMGVYIIWWFIYISAKDIHQFYQESLTRKYIENIPELYACANMNVKLDVKETLMTKLFGDLAPGFGGKLAGLYKLQKCINENRDAVIKEMATESLLSQMDSDVSSTSLTVYKQPNHRENAEAMVKHLQDVTDNFNPSKMNKLLSGDDTELESLFSKELAKYSPKIPIEESSPSVAHIQKEATYANLVWQLISETPTEKWRDLLKSTTGAGPTLSYLVGAELRKYIFAAKRKQLDAEETIATTTAELTEIFVRLLWLFWKIVGHVSCTISVVTMTWRYYRTRHVLRVEDGPRSDVGSRSSSNRMGLMQPQPQSYEPELRRSPRIGDVSPRHRAAQGLLLLGISHGGKKNTNKHVRRNKTKRKSRRIRRN